MGNMDFLDKGKNKKGDKKKKRKRKFKKMKGNNKLITVKPHEVLEDCNDTRVVIGLAVIVVYCPDELRMIFEFFVVKQWIQIMLLRKVVIIMIMRRMIPVTIITF